MWTLTGPFDGEVVGELGFQKTKLLKTGTSYPLGRKGNPLIIANKKISSLHCEFVVGSYSVADMGDPTKRPTIEFTNKKDKGMRIKRGEVQIDVNPSATYELQDGDAVTIVSGVSIIVQWVAVCCYSQPVRGKSTVSLDACASLGVCVVPIPNSHVTHHLLSTYVANASVAASLLSACQLVKHEWINEVIRLGSLPDDDSSATSSLEHTFLLPPTSKFRPSFSVSLLPAQKVFKVWEPNEERLNMLAGYRFLCVGEKGRELESDFRDIVERGGASFEAFDVTAGKTKFHRALTRGQAKAGKLQLVIAKEQGVQAAIGKDGWRELLGEARSFDVHFIEPEILVQVVVALDTSLFDRKPSADMDVDEVCRSSSPLPDFIPNTHPDEPSIAPPEPERRPIRRAASRQPSEKPSPVPKSPSNGVQQEESVGSSRPRRALTRRVNAGVPVVTGLDDPSSILDNTPDISAPPSPVLGPPVIIDLATPATTRNSRLKRRVVGGVASEALGSDILALGIDEPPEQPPLKKFKALFDASHPDRTGASAFDENALEEMQSTTLGGSSQTQSQSQAAGRATRSSRSGAKAKLSSLREEEEETQSGAVWTGSQKGTKRSLEDANEDIEMDDTLTSGAGSGQHQAKKRAVENLNAAERTSDNTSKSATPDAASKPPSTINVARASKGGAAPGQPDKDAAFLQAIASTKRGKKTEDEFDRDFNKLKISKPDLVHAEPEKQWAILEEFGDETNLRGNFMVVVEMPVFNHGDRVRRKHDGAVEWQGKPNFKKFRKREGFTRSSKIELVVTEENDYGMGPSYWKGGNTQHQSQDTEIKVEDPFANGRNQALIINDSDEEVIAPPRRGRSKASSRARSAIAAPPKKSTTRSARVPGKTDPLFLDSDDEDVIQEEVEAQLAASDDDTQTLMSTAGTTRAKALSRKKKPVPILADDDSDDGVFKGFRSKKR